MNRAEKVERAQELRARGLLLRQIAEEMDSKVSTVHAWLSDPDLAKHRARRARYAGKCVDCGAPTDGSDGPGKAAQRCASCNGVVRGKANQFWTREKVVAAIRAWAEQYGEPPAVPDWRPYQSRVILRDPERAARAEQGIARRDHPDASTVFDIFGSWVAAIAAAGFDPRARHGGDGNELRRRSQRGRVAA